MFMQSMQCYEPKGFMGIIMTPKELSIIVAEDASPEIAHWSEFAAEYGGQVDMGWTAMELQGTFEFTVVGVMAKLSALLAGASVSLLAQSSFDTDYIFVKDAEGAAAALTAGGITVLP